MKTLSLLVGSILLLGPTPTLAGPGDPIMALGPPISNSLYGGVSIETNPLQFISIGHWPFAAKWNSCTVSQSVGFCHRDEYGLGAFVADDGAATTKKATSAALEEL